jgi:hypothetical protein
VASYSGTSCWFTRYGGSSQQADAKAHGQDPAEAGATCFSARLQPAADVIRRRPLRSPGRKPQTSKDASSGIDSVLFTEAPSAFLDAT